MTREELKAAIRRRCPHLIEEAVEGLAKDADEYAAHEAERIAHPPYKPARKIDLGHEQAKRARTRSHEKELA